MLPSPIKLIKFERVPKKPLIVLHMEKPLNRGSQCELQLAFFGKMYNDTSEALFRHQYVDTANGEKKWYAATHFRPNLARRVFPCFDEPALKATFLLSVARQKHMTALSNMPLLNSEEM